LTFETNVNKGSDKMKMKSRKIDLFSYLLGIMVSIILFLVCIYFVFPFFDNELRHNELRHNELRHNELREIPLVLRKIPSNIILDEIMSTGGKYDNIIYYNILPEGMFYHEKHNTIAVAPHEKLGARLRSNISIRAHFLKYNVSRNLGPTFDYMYYSGKDGEYARNMNPPLLYLNNKLDYSDSLEDYIKSESTLSYLFSSNELGFRNTYPLSNGNKEVLLIGDSVAFGLGVDDRNTVASHLQQKIGDDYKVINAGSTGFGTDQNFAMIDEFKDRKFSHLIYIICENDLEADYPEEYPTGHQTLMIIKRLKNKFSHKFDHMTIVLHSNIYTLYHYAYADEMEQMHDSINQFVFPMTKDSNISFLSWPGIAKEYLVKIKKSLFAVDALYVDECHFSSEGNELLASHIQKISFK